MATEPSKASLAAIKANQTRKANKAKQIKHYAVTYTIPACTGFVQIEAETPEEAVLIFERQNLTRLFNRSEGDDPVMESMTEYTEDQCNDIGAQGKEIGLDTVKGVLA